MSEKKPQKQIKFIDYQLNAKMATTDKNSPRSIFLEFTCHIEPLYKKESYLDDLKIIKHKYRKAIERYIEDTGIFLKKYINNIEVSANCLKLYNHSYLTIQTYLAQRKKDEPLSLDVIGEVTEKETDALILDITRAITNRDFVIYKKKPK